MQSTVWINCGGSSKRKCKCSKKNMPKPHGWSLHWKKIKRKKKFPKYCSFYVKKPGDKKFTKCINEAELGAHIRRKYKSLNNNQYIVPACKSCNNSKKWSFKLKDNVKKARAVTTYCKK